MKIHPLIAGAFVTAVFTIQAWTLVEVVNLKVAVATLSARIEQKQTNENTHTQSSIASN
jgi:hypothetical protein